MATVKTSDVIAYIAPFGGSLVPVKNNFNLRGPNGSINVGMHKNNRWESSQFLRAWGDPTGIPNPRW